MEENDSRSRLGIVEEKSSESEEDQSKISKLKLSGKKINKVSKTWGMISLNPTWILEWESRENGIER